MTTGNGDGFTIKEILVEVRKDLNALIERIDRIDRQGSIGTKQELEDHEKRLRGLEEDRSRARGAIIVLSALIAIIVPTLTAIAISVWV